ncbi:nudix hydrolase homolog 15 [Striga asiatica]|uniref:Nudix hydrolase homolog 15 n=1 Tax=Striga asiatica TaxID=4170 RepID=A0A5A7PGF7_STRAF|nr:nudix hydrolase homolog 15 [Striga asiatica]
MSRRSRVGFAETATLVAQQPVNRFRPKRAAVLVCLFEGDDGGIGLILTKRSSRLSTHSGEVTLPGGKMEETDSNDVETAMREAKEEIGLDPSFVNIIADIMYSNISSLRSENLVKVAQRLRLYKASQNLTIPNGIVLEDSKIRDSLFKVGPYRAAVLICLFEGERGDLRVILTRRSLNMSSHSGEVVLPGGKWEEGDHNDCETALREANEEIGLEPSAVEVVTILEPFYSAVMGFSRRITIFPVIAIMWDKTGFKPNPNPTEVESVFDAPLEMFLKNENRREEMVDWMGYKYLIHSFDYRACNNKSYVISALTAAILIRASSVVYQRAPDFHEGMIVFQPRSRH